jgi:hypothetical protein
MTVKSLFGIQAFCMTLIPECDSYVRVAFMYFFRPKCKSLELDEDN